MPFRFGGFAVCRNASLRAPQTNAMLQALVIILNANDVIFAEIASGLDFDKF